MSVIRKIQRREENGERSQGAKNLNSHLSPLFYLLSQ